jgi:ring-1,2-phenylacetyl-CoA epoxidase subunit PaaD
MVSAYDIAANVLDPEVPVLTLADLGILRDVEMQGKKAVVTITPTYSGCPAMSAIELDLIVALEKGGYEKPLIKTVLSPAWTTDWITPVGLEKLKTYGIAPPKNAKSSRALFAQEQVACPRCESNHTEQLAEFGSTSCKAMWRCLACKEPFDYFKCH